MTVRKELYEKAKKTYKALLDRMSKRYSPDYQYVISDRVSFECTKMEDIFRPMWGIAPFINDGSLTVTPNGKEIQANDFINMIMLDGTRKDSPIRFDRNVTEETEETFANQSVTEIAAYLVAVCFAKEKLWDVLTVKPYYCPMGDGNIDFESVIKTAREAGTKYFIVEQDNAALLPDTLAQVEMLGLYS